MKDFQEYTTFITGAGSSIELDVEQAPLDEVADATIMQEATQQTTDRFGDEQIDYEINVSVSAVPVPAAVWLFGSALAGLGWMKSIIANTMAAAAPAMNVILRTLLPVAPEPAGAASRDLLCCRSTCNPR